MSYGKKTYLTASLCKDFRQRWDTVFPGRDKDQHVDVKSISKQVGDRQACFKKSRDGSRRQMVVNSEHGKVSQERVAQWQANTLASAASGSPSIWMTRTC